VPYNVTSTNPDQKYDNLVDKKLAELDARLAALETRLGYVEKRVK
jgi:hypothetical protein